MTATVPVRGVLPWGFLRAAEGEPRGFWARGERWVAHRGMASVIVGRGARRFARIRELAAQLPQAPEGVRVRLYGGFAFREDHHPEGAWDYFAPGAFHLPVAELTGDASGSGRLRVQALVPAAEVGTAQRRLEAQVGALAESLAKAADIAGTAPIHGTVTATRRDAWGEAVQAVLAAIGEGSVSKAVLARTLDVDLEATIGPVDLTETLWVRNPGTHVFFFEPRAGRALVGAAPEALATVRAGIFHATAVAGSVGVGRDAAERRSLAEQLLASEKDRAEHRWVVDEMVERLGEVATDIRAGENPHVLTLARIQHLETEIRARVPADRHVLDMVEALHPTPAVCGVPRDAALELLQREEPFDRGWYAGPVGWFATDGDGHFVPALRTAVGDGRRWRLFAGAGIVDGSSAQGEWDETGIKFQPVLRALEARGAQLTQTGDR
ncbi:MAG: isochorismate synthase [Gemmatimonadetes bacterium]|nr:isochorismate synthase [Gemmatimonadota bacterium]